MPTNEAYPLVSILIPAYNAETWIRQCIESALGQSYRAVEIIVADDGSTDRTVEEIRRFGDRVKFFQSRHAGANVVRNALTHLARGQWLQYLDADDYLLPNKIWDQMSFLRASKWRYDLVYSPMIVRQESTGREYATTIEPPFDPHVQFLRWGSFCTHGILLRRAAVLEVGGWLEAQPVCQEHELIFRLLTAGKTFGVWNNAAAVYRHHGCGTISTKSPLRTMRTRMGITDRFEAWLEHTESLTPACRQEAYKSRMDTARASWTVDEAFGRELARFAARRGHFWVPSHSAMPLAFQIANRLCGFQTAQAIASLARGVRPPAKTAVLAAE